MANVAAATRGPAPAEKRELPTLLRKYQDEIAPALMKRFGITNRMAAPKLMKIVVNMGCGEAAHDAKILEQAQRDLATITGQRALVTRAKQAVSNFKIKEGDAVGVKVTLRRDRMYEFLERFISASLPRIRDFRGLSARGFDQQGNYSCGIRDHSIFAELHLDEVRNTLGMDIAFVTTGTSAEHSRALLEAFGIPFEKPPQKSA